MTDPSREIAAIIAHMVSSAPRPPEEQRKWEETVTHFQGELIAVAPSITHEEARAVAEWTMGKVDQAVASTYALALVHPPTQGGP